MYGETQLLLKLDEHGQHWLYRVYSTTRLIERIANVTNIPPSLLKTHSTPGHYSFAQKMSWVGKRETTRLEDMSYCLLGLLGVNMPLLYGEGGHRAWSRLLEEVVKSSPDETIFVFPHSREEDAGVLAPHPSSFKDCGHDKGFDYFLRPPYAVTNQGLELRVKAGNAFLCESDVDKLGRLLLPLNCFADGGDGPYGSFPIILGLRKLLCGHFECRVEGSDDLYNELKELGAGRKLLLRDTTLLVHTKGHGPCSKTQVNNFVSEWRKYFSLDSLITRWPSRNDKRKRPAGDQ